MESRDGVATVRGTSIAFGANTLLWFPGDIEGTMQVDAGAQGYFISISEDLLMRIVANSSEALHLRRAIDRFALIPPLQAAAQSCPRS